MMCLDYTLRVINLENKSFFLKKLKCLKDNQNRVLSVF